MDMDEELINSLDELGLKMVVDEEEKHNGTVFDEHSDAVFFIEVHPFDDRVAVSGGADDKAMVWDTETGSLIYTLEGHSDSVVSASFSSDGQLIATAGMDGIVNVWSADTGTLERTLEGPSEAIEWMQFHPKGHVICAGSSDGTIWLWNADKGVVLNVLAGHGGSVQVGGIDELGKKVISGGADGKVLIWSPLSGDKVGGQVFESPVCSMDFDASVVACGSELGEVKLIAQKNGKQVASLFEDIDTKDVSIETLAISPGSDRLAMGTVSGIAAICDLSAGTKTRLQLPHADGVVKVLWDPLGRPFLYTGCLDGSCRAWDIRSGECITEWSAHTKAVLDLAIGPSALKLFSSGDDGMAFVYELHDLLDQVVSR